MLLASLNVSSSVLSEGGGVTVDLAPLAILAQMVLLIILLLVLKPVLFDPMLKLFAEREKRIDGAIKTVGISDTKSAKALAEYEAAMAETRAAANAERERIRAEGVRAENEILEKVRLSTAELLENGKRSAMAQAAEVRAVLKADSTALGKDVASRVLGREVQS